MNDIQLKQIINDFRDFFKVYVEIPKILTNEECYICMDEIDSGYEFIYNYNIDIYFHFDMVNVYITNIDVSKTKLMERYNIEYDIFFYRSKDKCDINIKYVSYDNIELIKEILLNYV